jgi:lysyl-tRNA synthetase class I
LSQPAQIQYTLVLLKNGETMTTKVAHGMTVSTIHSMWSTERIRFMVLWVI